MWVRPEALYKGGRGLPGAQDALPPPAIVFRGQLEVGEGHRDASSDADHNQHDHQKYTIESIGLPAP